MATQVIQLKDFASTLDRWMDNSLMEQKAAAIQGIVNYLPEIIKQSPVDTGLFAASWDFSVEEESVIFGNTAPHAPIIEDGARPFTPPLGPLLAWAKRVLRDESQPPEYSDAVWALAIHTRNKIQEEGMEPKHIMQKNIPSIIESIREELRKL